MPTDVTVTIFLVSPPLPIPCMCGGFLLHLVAVNDTHTLGRTPLYEWSARRRDLYLTTNNTQNRHPYPGGIRTRNPSSWAAADRAATTIFPLIYKTRSFVTLFTISWLPHTLFLSEDPWYSTSLSTKGVAFTIIEEKWKIYIFHLSLPFHKRRPSRKLSSNHTDKRTLLCCSE